VIGVPGSRFHYLLRCLLTSGSGISSGSPGTAADWRAWGRSPLSTARLLRGAPVARRIRQDVQVAAENLRSEFGVQPTVATLLVGNAGPSAAYHEAIGKAMGGCGIDHVDVTLPVSASTSRVVDELQRLNEDRGVHGILVLLPLPHHIDSLVVISSVSADKDVDGISPQSVGRLHLGLPALHPSTPQAGLEILDHYQIHRRQARHGHWSWERGWQADGGAPHCTRRNGDALP
jgi:hypothetical protein